MEADYRFRPVEAADFPLLRAWRRQPHVQLWWGDPAKEDPEETFADPNVAMWVVAWRGRPFAYAQD